mgnify:CR=1 FL=1
MWSEVRSDTNEWVFLVWRSPELFVVLNAVSASDWNVAQLVGSDVKPTEAELVQGLDLSVQKLQELGHVPTTLQVNLDATPWKAAHPEIGWRKNKIVVITGPGIEEEPTPPETAPVESAPVQSTPVRTRWPGE